MKLLDKDVNVGDTVLLNGEAKTVGNVDDSDNTVRVSGRWFTTDGVKYSSRHSPCSEKVVELAWPSDKEVYINCQWVPLSNFQTRKVSDRLEKVFINTYHDAGPCMHKTEEEARSNAASNANEVAVEFVRA